MEPSTLDSDAGSLSSGERNVTLASKRKMSQRQKTSRSSHSTQTDLSTSSSCLSLLDTATTNGVAGDASSVYGNSDATLLSPAHVTRVGTSSSLLSSSTATAASDNQQLNGEFYEDAATLFDKLVKTEEVSRSCITVHSVFTAYVMYFIVE